MIANITSLPALETALFRLQFKKKKFIYDIARLEYRIWAALTKLETVNKLIAEEEENIASLTAAIAAAGKGKVKEKLKTWLVKVEYKLFKLQIRKNKAGADKIIINQSKLKQTKEALISLENTIGQIESQVIKINTEQKAEISLLTNQTQFIKQENFPFYNKSAKILKEDVESHYLNLAS